MISKMKTFEISERSQALVVAPAGAATPTLDADLQREGMQLKDYLHDEGIQALVIDLGRASYHSSLMIGILNSLGHTVRQNGGKMVLCQASPDMLGVLRIMRVDSLWPHYASLAEALKAVQVGS